jgi:magnesium-transporting ATPase (P-type)
MGEIEEEIKTHSAEYLFRKIKKTAKTKFNCEYRLNLHKRISFWVINISSIILLVINIFDLIKNTPPNYFSIASLICSLFILTYSMLLKNSSNEENAKNMNTVATELLHLADKIQPYCNKDINIESYNKFADEYKSILLKSNTATLKIDYEYMKIDFRKHYDLKYRNILFVKFKYYLGFIHYFFVLLFIVFIAFFLIFMYKGN